MEVTYKLEPYSATVRDAYLHLLPEQERAVEAGKLEWKLSDHPAGKAMIATASTPEHGVIGINTFMAGRFKVGRYPASGFQSMDTVVSPAARGQGVFGNLLETFYDQADADVLYGFPNLNSSPGFFGKLGWAKFGAVPMLFRPLRSGYFLKKLAPWLPDVGIPLPSSRTHAAKPITCFGDDHTRLWRVFSHWIRCAVSRDAEFLNWRLFQHPTEKYTVIGTNGAWVAYTVVPKHGGRIGYLMEAIGTEWELQPLVPEALHRMKDEGADAALAWCLPWSPNYKAHRKAGFYPLPEKIRPIRFNFGARALQPDSAEAMEAKSWYVSYLDSDTA